MIDLRQRFVDQHSFTFVLKSVDVLFVDLGKTYDNIYN